MIEEVLLVYRAYIQHLLFLGVAICAWRRGDQPEKWAATTFSVMIAVDYTLHFILPAKWQTYESINIGHLVIDAGVFGVLLWLSLQANRIYPLWLLAAQLIQLLNHFNREVASSIEPRVYFVLTVGPSYIQLVALILGLAAHIRRVKKHGHYRAWRRS